jgi:hypothetical protein
MWIAKGIGTGLVLFFVETVVYLFAKLQPIEQSKATSVSLLKYLTVSNPYFWAVFFASLALGLFVADYWSKLRPI